MQERPVAAPNKALYDVCADRLVVAKLVPRPNEAGEAGSLRVLAGKRAGTRVPLKENWGQTQRKTWVRMICNQKVRE